MSARAPDESVVNPIGRSLEWIRWQRLLARCRLDPDTLPLPLRQPNDRDFMIVGCPRSGTSLVAALLFNPPDSVVCMEPWDGLQLPPADLFDSIRHEIDESKHLARGRLDIEGLEAGEVRWRRDRQQSVPLEMSEGYSLGVKWPGFWRYLPLLPRTRMIVCVRHPVEVLTSFERVGGRLAQGLEYDVAFHRKMNAHLRQATDDSRIRRALLYEYINSRIAPFLGNENVLAVRYERWETEPINVLKEISSFLGVTLPSTPRIPIHRSPQPQRPDLDSLALSYCPSSVALGYGL